MGYCHRCGVYADLCQDTKMCAACLRDWRPAAHVPADLGYHRQPQPLTGP